MVGTEERAPRSMWGNCPLALRVHAMKRSSRTPALLEVDSATSLSESRPLCLSA